MAAVKVASEDSLFVLAIAFVKAHVLLVALLAFTVRLLVKRFASPLRRIPGPALASVSRLWKGKTSRSLRVHDLTIP